MPSEGKPLWKCAAAYMLTQQDSLSLHGIPERLGTDATALLVRGIPPLDLV